MILSKQRIANSAQLKENIGDKSKEELHELNEKQLLLVVWWLNGKGKVSFAHIQDREGQPDLRSYDEVGEEKSWDFLKKADLGDF